MLLIGEFTYTVTYIKLSQTATIKASTRPRWLPIAARPYQEWRNEQRQTVGNVTRQIFLFVGVATVCALLVGCNTVPDFAGMDNTTDVLNKVRSVDLLPRSPTQVQAGTYSAAMHYLKAVKAAGTKEAKAVMAKMKEMPINDFMTKNGTIRQDGRVIRDMYLLATKDPSESKGEWDLMKVAATIPGKEAFRPLSESECPLVQQAK